MGMDIGEPMLCGVMTHQVDTMSLRTFPAHFRPLLPMEVSLMRTYVILEIQTLLPHSRITILGRKEMIFSYESKLIGLGVKLL